ncbi:dnaJ ERDJ3B [Micractinium conductrix]|uniref:DnaJ ERDJ3B n=1 Tax=Micractinium conductrix TaxID=554055 RepID=A0A2P6V2Q2_9CHLO|nr:dnaJ ERDJ3B [Micractinium conductrix]|eukprot:PSC68376.1 dnaJ ERDJ3B [Micractinium conductrix]
MWCAPEEERASSLYSILELPSISVTQEEIKQQWRRLALRYHPDKSGGSGSSAAAAAAERFHALREAYQVLSDPSRRAAYDKGLVAQLDMEEYLQRFSELVLTVQGFCLPLHRTGMRRGDGVQQPPAQLRAAPLPQPQRQRRGCHQQHHGHVHAQQQMHCAPRWGGMLPRA